MLSLLVLLYPSFFTLRYSGSHLKPSPTGDMSVLKFLCLALIFALLILLIKTSLKHWTHWKASISSTPPNTHPVSPQSKSRYLGLRTHTWFASSCCCSDTLNLPLLLRDEQRFDPLFLPAFSFISSIVCDGGKQINPPTPYTHCPTCCYLTYLALLDCYLLLSPDNPNTHLPQNPCCIRACCSTQC
jgi:hypothetical protein